MKLLPSLLIILSLVIGPMLHAQKGKNKGGGGKGDKTKVDIKIKTDQTKIKVKSGGKNDQIKIDIKSKGNDHWKHERRYGNKSVIWFFGPGDIYQCKGKSKKQKVIIFDQVCVRLSTNIGFMFGLLGDVRINLDSKKAKMEPKRYKKIKLEIDLLEEELKLIEVKKNKIKIRLGKIS